MCNFISFVLTTFDFEIPQNPFISWDMAHFILIFQNGPKKNLENSILMDLLGWNKANNPKIPDKTGNK